MCGAQADDGARPRHRRPGRLRARLPGDPASVGLLRRQVRRSADSPTPFAPSCCMTAAERLDHDGPAAGGEHAPVQLVPDEAAQPPAAGAADLPARGARGGRLLGGPPPPTRARRWRQRGQGDLRQPTLPRLADWYLARTGYAASRSATCRCTAARTTCSSPFRQSRHAWHLRPARTHRSHQLWANTHRALVARRGVGGCGSLPGPASPPHSLR